MSLLAESNIHREVKENGKRLDALLAEQKRTNLLLEQLVQVMQGQPRVFHPSGAPWQEPAGR